MLWGASFRSLAADFGWDAGGDAAV